MTIFECIDPFKQGRWIVDPEGKMITKLDEFLASKYWPPCVGANLFRVATDDECREHQKHLDWAQLHANNAQR